jgi:hypothetical protein
MKDDYSLRMAYAFFVGLQAQKTCFKGAQEAK